MRFSTFLMSVACLSACVPILGDDFEIVPGGGTGGTGANGSCTIGETTCADAATLSTCPAGQAVLEPCPAETPVCAGSACVVCEEGSARCSGDDVEVCTNQTWAPGESCDLGCDAGACLRVIDIGAGAAHTCAVLSNGSVRCWGYNKIALLYLDSLDDPAEPGSYVTVPTEIGAMTDAKTVEGGDAHSCALTNAGKVFCWGWNGIGQLGQGTIADSPDAVEVPLDAVATDLSVSVLHGCAALETGALFCWGLNEDGQLGNGQSGAGAYEPSPIEVPLPVPAQDASLGWFSSCTIVSSGDAMCWGGNLSGQLGNGTTVGSPDPISALGDGVTHIDIGAYHGCGLMQNQLWCWGRNAEGQLGNGTTMDSLTPVLIGSFQLDAIELGGTHSCVVAVGGTLQCWGDNESGQVGNGMSGAGMSVNAPFTVDLGATVTDVAAGAIHTCALTEDGTVYCWGDNSRGQLGTGDTNPRTSPTAVTW